VQCVRQGIPHDLVDPHRLAGLVFLSAEGAAKTDEKHGLRRRGGDIDRAVEWDGQPSLQGESIQRVDGVEILALGDMNRTVRVGQVHTASGVVGLIRDREDVRWERRRSRMAKIEERVNAARPRQGAFRNLTSGCTPGTRMEPVKGGRRDHKNYTRGGRDEQLSAPAHGYLLSMTGPIACAIRASARLRRGRTAGHHQD
jgi:hypothetical protein